MSQFLFIVNAFPPINNQNSLRALELSKRLVQNKIYPIILTRRIERRESKDYNLIKKIPKNLKIFRTPIIELKRKYSIITLFFKITQKIFYIYTYIHWVPFGYLNGKYILKNNKNIKFIFATGPPYYSHMIGYLLKKKFNIPLILEYRDPWNFNPYIIKSKRNLYEKVSLRIEKRLLNSADMIFSISEPLKQFLFEHYNEVSKKTIYVIANGLDLKENINDTEKKDDKIVFTFIGKLYGQRDITPLLKIISALKKKGYFENFDFLLKIFGTYQKEFLKKIIEELKIQNMVYLGDFLNRDRIFEEINKCYLTIHIGENLNYPTIGFKVLDYLSCRKKVLYLGKEDSFTGEFLKKNDFGVIIPINNLNRGIKIFENLINDIINNKFYNEINKEKIMIFSWDNITNQFIKIISKFL